MKDKHLFKIIFFLVTAILMSIYLIWRIFFTLPFDQGLPQVIFGILLLIAEMITVFTTFELYYRKIKSENINLELPDIAIEDYPDIDVFIATHNESVDLLYKTVNACTYMDYPDKRKVHIYLCDDGNRQEVASLANELNVGYLGLADNKHAKSGNYNNALANTNSPLVATFDADMIPRHTFLMETVPYFFLPYYIKEDNIWRKRNEDEIEDKKIGLIQTPQSFYNPDLFQFNLYAENTIPNEQDFFSKEVNIMRNSSNSIAYTGSNTVISREALEEIEGFPLKTITEDFETSIRIQKAGYLTYATDKVQAAGLSTTDIPSMIKQRTRWARGVIQSLQNTHAIFTPKLSLASKITYLSAYLYWWSFLNRIIFILAPIMFALFDFQVVNTDFVSLLIFWLPGYFFYSMSMRYLSSNIRNQRWSQVIDTILAPYLIIPVLLETLHIHQTKFKVTSKKKSNNRKSNFYYAIFHIILLVLSILAIIRFVRGKYGWALVYSSIIIFWLVYNLVAIIYALFFMIGRDSPRRSERIKANCKVEIMLGNTINAYTRDVSEHGISFVVKDNVYLPNDDEINIIVSDGNYRASLEGMVVYVKEIDDGWLYAMEIEPVDITSKREYLQIIYDRDHSLPTEMDLWSTAYDDFMRNVNLRIKPKYYEKRQQPRFNINKRITFINGASGIIKDFNYQYVSIADFKEGKGNPDTYVWFSTSGIWFVLEKTKKTNYNNEMLFKVKNLNDLNRSNQIELLIKDLEDLC